MAKPDISKVIPSLARQALKLAGGDILVMMSKSAWVISKKKQEKARLTFAGFPTRP